MTALVNSLHSQDDFDEDHPAVIAELGRIHAHNKCEPRAHKYWLDPGFVGLGELTVLFAPPFTGKSFMAVDMACRFAGGLHWDGSPMWQPQSVLYLATERGEQIVRRVDAYCQHHGVERFENLFIRSGLVDLTDYDSLLAIIRATQIQAGDDHIDVVIVDTLSNALPGSDSNTELVSTAMRNVKRAMQEADFGGDAGPTFILVHHTPKDSPTTVRGAGQIIGDADTTILLSNKRGVLSASVQRSNDLAPDQPARYFKLEGVSFGKNEDGFETTSAVVVPCEPPKAAKGKTTDMPAATRKALDTLRAAIKANGGAVTESQWRDAVYAEAGDISESGKRQRYIRAKAAVSDYLIEDKGLFAISERVTERDKA